MKQKKFDCLKMVREIRDKNANKTIHDIVVDANTHLEKNTLFNKFQLYK